MAEPDAAARIRDAATIILVRERSGVPQVLMGQRGAKAVFMPDKFVFPGGALDAEDTALAQEAPEDAETRARLLVRSNPEVARALPYTAVRGLWEGTGIMLGRADAGAAARPVPPGWAGFYARGVVPDVSALRLVFRAITPPGRPRRFDARFFLYETGGEWADDAHTLENDGELRHLQWLDIAAARQMPLPFITEVVLSEMEARLAAPGEARRVPFFDHAEDGSHFRLL